MQKKPLVSIIIPCYNREGLIGDAIESCLRQTYENIEIIVVDDGSTDDSIKLIQSYGSQLKLITQPNQGVSVARNTGLNNASGEYVIMLDSDDWISEDLVEQHLKTHKKWDDIAISCSDSRTVNHNGEISKLISCNWPSEPSIPLRLFLLNPPPFPACEMYKTSIMKNLGGYFEDLRASADSSLRLRIVLNGYKVVRTNGGYGVYRPAENSLTRNRLKLHYYALKLIKKLKTEFRSSKYFIELLETRKRRQRYRYWFATLAFHTSLKPSSIIKFLWHLSKVTRVDPTYIVFIIRNKPWKSSREDALKTIID
jgi:glycosyltransferase involved in cell wall biosynthesis